MNNEKEPQPETPQSKISEETLIKVAQLIMLLQRKAEREELKRQEAITNGRPETE
jgi:hypothetical protein